MPLHTTHNQPDQPPIQTMIVEKMEQMTQEPETVIILDWDDTLLCSSFLQENQYKLTSELYDLNREVLDSDSDEVKLHREVAFQLKELESCVVSLLTQSIAFSHRTCVITNAEHGWVELSCMKFFPNVVPLLQSVTVISARSQFEHLFPGCPLKWKYFAMHQVLVGAGSGFFGRSKSQVISLGDSHVEREAVRAVCKNVPFTRTKSVKFAERPTVEQLRRQLELVNQCFSYITSHDNDLDLQLTVTVNPQAVPPQAPLTPTNTVNDAAIPPPPTTTATKMDDADCDMHAEDAKDENTTLTAACDKLATNMNANVNNMIEA